MKTTCLKLGLSLAVVLILAPMAVLNDDASKRVLELKAHPGEMVTLSAAGSKDPDDNALTKTWFVYPEAGMFNGEVFEKHPHAWPEGRGFYERFMRGEKPQAGWVSESDFEKAPIPQP